MGAEPVPGRFAGQGWLVTGGTRGIGLAIACAAREEGATVWVCARDTVDDPYALPCDVADEASVEQLFDDVMERLPSLDVVVNNAGGGLDKLLVQTSLEEWNSVIGTNLRGPFLVCRRAIEEFMGVGGGRIVNVASFAANGLVGQGAYATAKAGLISLGRSVSKEYGRAGVICNTVVPGFVDTGMVAGLPPKLRAKYEALSTLGRFATPQEVAEAVLFLASSDAAFVAGDELYVTGGSHEVPR